MSIISLDPSRMSGELGMAAAAQEQAGWPCLDLHACSTNPSEWYEAWISPSSGKFGKKKKGYCLCQDMTVLLSVESRLRSTDEMSSLLLSPTHEKTRRYGNSGWHLLGALSLHSHPSASQMRKQAGTLRCVFKFKGLNHEFIRKPVSHLLASNRSH